MVKWIIKKNKDLDLPKLKDSILISGLPGIGNVGKIAMDFILDEVEPQLIYEIYSYAFPHSVFIAGDGIVELPSIAIYALKRKEGRDVLFLAGDVQPMDEESSYVLAEKVIELASELGCTEVLTLGGIGKPRSVSSPKIFTAATDKQTLDEYKKLTNCTFNTEGVVTNIVGAAGVLLGLAQLKGLKGASLLVETSAHPFHLGFEESTKLIEALNTLLGFKLDPKQLQDETEGLKKNMGIKKHTRQRRSKITNLDPEDTSYIG